MPIPRRSARVPELSKHTILYTHSPLRGEKAPLSRAAGSGAGQPVQGRAGACYCARVSILSLSLVEWRSAWTPRRRRGARHAPSTRKLSFARFFSRHGEWTERERVCASSVYILPAAHCRWPTGAAAPIVGESNKKCTDNTANKLV